MWLTLRRLRSLLVLLLVLVSSPAWAIVLTCQVSGIVTGPDNTPQANVLIIFNSVTSQVAQSQTIGPVLVSTQTDDAGNISIALIQGLMLQVTIGNSMPFQVAVPLQSTVSFADLVASVQTPNGGINIAGVSGGVPYFPSPTSIASSGLLAAGQPVVGGGAGLGPSTFAATQGSVLFAGPSGALAQHNNSLFWNDSLAALCVGCTDTTFGSTVNPRLAVAIADGGTAIAVGNTSGVPRFSLNPLASGGVAILDYGSGSFVAGFVQLAGKVGIGTAAPATGLEAATGFLASGVQFKTSGVHPTFAPFDGSNTAQLRLQELGSNGTDYVGFKAPNSIASSLTWTLPATDGINGQVLSTNGSGTLSWITSSGGGGGNMSNPMTTLGDVIYASATATPATPARLGIGTNGQCLIVSSGLPAWGACSGSSSAAGSDTQVQFNSSGSFAADSTFTFDATGKQLNVKDTQTGNYVPVGLRNLSNGNAAATELRIGNDLQAGAFTISINSSTFTGATNTAKVFNHTAGGLSFGANNAEGATLLSTGFNAVNLLLTGSTIAGLPTATAGNTRRLTNGLASGALVIADGSAWSCEAAKALNVAVVTCPPYNARGDGSTDDTTAIAAAITAAGSTGTVYFPNGTYYTPTGFTVLNTITLRGASRFGAILTTDQNIALLTITSAAGDLVGGGVYSLRLRQTGATPSSASRGLLLDVGTHKLGGWVLEDLWIEGSYYGIQSTGSGVLEFTQIQANFLGNNGTNGMQYGIYIGTGGTGGLIVNNQISIQAYTGGVTAEAIHVEGTGIGDLVINANHSEGGAYGVRLKCLTPFTYCSNFTVTDNKMDTVNQPIDLTHITQSRIANNRYPGATTTPVTKNASTLLNVYDTNNGAGVSYSDIVKINTESLPPLAIKGHLSSEMARFQALTDSTNQRSFITIYSTNPNYWWELSEEDTAGGDTSNGFALRERSNTSPVIRAYLPAGGGFLVGDPASGGTNIRLRDVGHIEATNGTPPTITGCGSGATLAGTDFSGVVTIGTSPGTCQVTFSANTWANAPHCFANNETSVQLARATGVTTFLFRISGTLTASDKIDYLCGGHY